MRKKTTEVIKEQGKMIFDFIIGTIITVFGAGISLLLDNLLIGGILGGSIGMIAMFIWKKRRFITTGVKKAKEVKDTAQEIKENPKDVIVKVMLSKWSILPANVKEKIGEVINLKDKINEHVEQTKDFQFKILMVQVLKVRKMIRNGQKPEKETLNAIAKQAKIGGFAEIEKEIAYYSSL
jgi:hypothetical protein